MDNETIGYQGHGLPSVPTELKVESSQRELRRRLPKHVSHQFRGLQSDMLPSNRSRHAKVSNRQETTFRLLRSTSLQACSGYIAEKRWKEFKVLKYEAKSGY